MDLVINLTKHMMSGLGFAALVIIAFSLVSRVSRSRMHREILLGLLFGLGAAVSMLNPTVYAPGIVLDPRAVMLALAGPFGGLFSTLIAVIFASAMRIVIGGVGMEAGLVGILIAGGVGLAFRYVFRMKLNFFGLCALGLMTAAYMLSAFILPLDIALQILLNAGPAVVANNFVGIVLLGLVLAYEMRERQNYVNLKLELDRDPLTQLANRRALDRFGDQWQKNPHIRCDGAALILFDIDHFKQINDGWGHDVGDMVLQDVASLISGSVRKTDMVVRFGGEEMLVVLLNASAESAFGLAEAIRQKIAGRSFATDQGEFGITISAGIATCRQDDENLQLALTKADSALYKAKNGGRDRTEVAYRANRECDGARMREAYKS